jgi:hypothetical protein
VQGTLDLLILQTLQWGAQHGYGIAQAIRAGSGDVLRVNAGSLSIRRYTAGAQEMDQIGVDGFG